MTTEELLAEIDATLDAAGMHIEIEPADVIDDVDLLPYELWVQTHCYGCGRSTEEIAIEGPTPHCEFCAFQDNLDWNAHFNNRSEL